MFLTRITLTPKNFHDWRITDDYSLHRVVYSLFQDGERERFLYVDKGSRKGFYIILVLSAREPMKLPDLSMETKPIAESFLLHDRYAFEIILNPVKRQRKSGKLQPIIGQLPLLEWFMEKATQNGFLPDKEHLVTKAQPAQIFKGPSGCVDQRVVHHRVLFTGILTVTNRELFEDAFRNGIGRSKAFGFGLLQLNPLHD